MYNLIEIAVSLKYLGGSWKSRNLEKSLINCGINLNLTWSITRVITNSTCVKTFAITDAKRYASVATLSTQDNAKLWQQLKFDIKRTMSWNKYLSRRSTERRTPYLDYLADLSF